MTILPVTSALQTTAPSLFPYQHAGVERLVKDRRVLLADQMGLGKTVQAISALNRLRQDGVFQNKNGRILIVCPKSVLGVWQDELDTWLDPPSDGARVEISVATGSKAPLCTTPRMEDHHDCNTPNIILSIQLINYDICHKHREQLQAHSYDVLICDEAHYLKSMATKRTQAVLGASHCNGISSRYLWLLTGTPILNRPVELYPLLRAIDPSAWGTFQQYTERYCSPPRQHQNYSSKRWQNRAIKANHGASNLGELSERLRPVMLRRYKADVLSELPPKLRSCVRLDDGSNAARMERERVVELMMMENSGDHGDSGDARSASIAYSNEDAKDFISKSNNDLGEFSAAAGGLLQYLGLPPHVLDALLRDNEQGDGNSNRILGTLATIRKETALLKVRPAIQLLKDAVLSQKVVVFAHHRAVIQEVVEEFGDAAVSIVGGMDTESRSEAVRRFQNDDSVRLFVGSIRAAGVGVTLTAASHVVFLELDWSPAIMAQAEDRCHRVGQRDNVHVQYCVFQDTVDEWIARQLLAKQNDIDRVLSCTPGGESSRQEKVYTMDFGKHKGLRIEDVPRDYLTFLVETDNGAVWRSRPALWRALAANGLVREKPPPLSPAVQSQQAVDYAFEFGKHRGIQWKEVPPGYRDWVLREQIWRTNPNLKDALTAAGILDEGMPESE